MLRAHSVFEVKSADTSRGVIHGIASTPDVDVVGDVMEPLGAVFNLPLPLLHEHDRKSPIGHVIAARPTADGIEITAEVARGVTARIDEIWLMLKAGLIRGLSIGFQGIESEPVKGTRGRRYKSWRWMELSCVVLPANAAAGILAVKRADHAVLHRLGLMGAQSSSTSLAHRMKEVLADATPSSTSLANQMKLALLDATPDRPPPMLMVGAIRYEMIVHRDPATELIASVVLEPISFVQLPREAA